MFKLKLWGAAVSWLLLSSVAVAQTYDAPETLKKKDKSEAPVRPGNQALGPLTVLSPAGLVFASFDVNGDYKIDTTEFAKGQGQTYARIDKDKNDRLSLFEVESWREVALGSKDASPSGMYFDGNFNQVITRAEYDDAFSDMFKRADRDDDGTVKFSELIRVMERPARPQRRDSGAREERQRRGPPQGGGRGRR